MYRPHDIEIESMDGSPHADEFLGFGKKEKAERGRTKVGEFLHKIDPKALVNKIRGDKDQTANTPQTIVKQDAPKPQGDDKPKGMDKNTKIALGVGTVLILGVVGYFVFKK